MRWSGSVVLVTGGTRGLGLELIRQLADRGARVALCARNDRELSETRDELKRRGAEAAVIRCDVADPASVRSMVREVSQSMGDIDVVIANAGVISVGPAVLQTLDDYREAMDVMFWGVVNVVDAVVPGMRERGAGSIAVVTSIGGKVAVPHLLPYACAKFAAVAYAEGLAAELRSDGIHVTTVVPGLMRTGSHLNAEFKGQNEKEYSWFSLGASAPLVAVSAPRAAQHIIRAVERGAVEISIGLPAAVASRVHGLMPATTVRALSLVARMLPRPGGIQERKRSGRDSRTPLSESPLTSLGRRAASERRQYSAPR